MGDITAEQHEAATRFYRVCVLAAGHPHLGSAQLIAVHPAWDLSLAREVERIERAWGYEEARAIRSGMYSWVQAAPLTRKPRMALMKRLFALPAPSWKLIRYRDPQHMASRVSSLLDVMIAFWSDRDAGFGRA